MFRRKIVQFAVAYRNGVRLIGYVVSHPANEGRWIRSLIRAFMFQVSKRVLNREWVVSVGRGARMRAVPGSSASSKFVYANPPDWPEMCVWDRTLRAGDLFIDVGANVGGYSLFAGSLGANVIAVEPSASSAGELRRNVEMNPEFCIEVLTMAMSDEAGSSFIEGVGTTARLSDEGSSRVGVCRLDDVLGGRFAAGVKIDVEGAERLVLEGAISALQEKRIGLLQIEWNRMSAVTLCETREPVRDLLNQFGYEVLRPEIDSSLVPFYEDYSCRDVFARPCRL